MAGPIKVLRINGSAIPPGTRASMDIPIGLLHTHAPVTMPVHVIHSKKPGPRLFVCAAVHGDEIIGVEIIRRLLKLAAMDTLRGALIAVPVVNALGFIHHSRYLPDRRDLNRSFPGSEKGSLTARLAHLFMREIVANATHGIDIHSGTLHRCNLPQIRANLSDPETARLARAFDVPVLLNANVRDGSLRQVAAEQGIPMLLYEAGEALRFDETSILAGVHGIVGVMRALEMLNPSKKARSTPKPLIATASTWIRAPQSGILRTLTELGRHVQKGEVLGMIADPFGLQEVEIIAPASGMIIGHINLPLVNEGEALFHLARVERRPGKLTETNALDEPAFYPSDEPPIM